MINATLFKNKQGFYRIKVDNHGDSIVCSAVSSLVLNAINYIDEKLDGKLTLSHEETGFLDFTMLSFNNKSDEAAAYLIMDFVRYGLGEIKKNYKNSIKINIVEDNSVF